MLQNPVKVYQDSWAPKGNTKQPHVPADYTFQFSANFEISNRTFKYTKNYCVEMQKRVIQADLGIFTHISAYSRIFRNYSGILRHNPDPV